MINKNANGVMIYILGGFLSFFVNLLDVGFFWFVFNMLFILLCNPFMIHIYDYYYFKKYFIHPTKLYRFLILFCYIFELFAWNFIRPIAGDKLIIFTFLGPILLFFFVINLLIVRYVKKNIHSKVKRYLLWLVPALTYDISVILLILSMVILLSWDGKI